MTDDIQPDHEQTASNSADSAPADPAAWWFDPEAQTAAYTAPSAMTDTAPLGQAPSTHRRFGARAISAVALVAVGAAAGAGVSQALNHHSSSANPSNSASGQNGSSGAGSNGGGLFGGSGSGSAPSIPGGSGFSFPGGSGFGGFGSGTGSTGSNTSDGPTDAASIARNVDPGVVDITTTIAGGEAAGTGMVLTSDGEVLTNNHVIDGATSISVRDVGNGKTYKATIVGYDRSQDVAVIKLTGASDLTTVKTATSEPSSGATVVGIGNAGGTGGTPSYAGGSITETNASITASDEYAGTSEKLTGLLATDADIQSGDSGGPLVNSSGEVVGMDTAASTGFSFGSTDSDSTASRGFAIPITTALQIAGEIVNGESSSTVHIGATAKLGVYVGSNQDGSSGATVEQTESGSPAAAAGITAGDIITSVDGTSVSGASDLTALMATLTPGSTVTVDYTTEAGNSRSAQVMLGSGAPQ